MIPDDHKEQPPQPVSSWFGKVRRLGLGLSIGGVLLVGVTVALTVSEVNRGAVSIMDPSKPIACGLIMLVFGLNMLAYGERAKDLLVMHQIDLREIRLWTWGVMIASIASGFLAYVLVAKCLTSWGYTRQSITQQSKPKPESNSGYMSE